jgi:carbohydrate-selective porin OprB
MTTPCLPFGIYYGGPLHNRSADFIGQRVSVMVMFRFHTYEWVESVNTADGTRAGRYEYRGLELPVELEVMP